MALADKLRDIREQNNLSQEALAEQLGVSRQAVSKWESGSAYPETEKILTICKLYGLSADELLMDKADPLDAASEQPQTAHARRRWKWILPMIALVVAATVFAVLWKSEKSKTDGLYLQLSRQEQQLAAQKQAQSELLKQIEEQTELVSGLKANPRPLENTSDGYALLQNHFFEISQKWRLDYVPVFSENDAPTESAEYLMWAFAVNLSNWGAETKGTMSKSYVEDMIWMHFAVPSVSHTPLPKTWNFDGGNYQAIAAGVNELPIYGLSSFSVGFEDGTAVFDVLLTQYGLPDGSIPTEKTYTAVKEQLAVGVAAELTPTMQERFVFTIGPNGPVFRAHEIL